MAELHSLLAGLKAELAAAEKLGKDSVADIAAEIARVEGLVSKEVHHDGVPTTEAKAAASDEERAARYLAGLREELAGLEKSTVADVKQRVADVKAEIARVEAPAAAAPAPAPADTEAPVSAEPSAPAAAKK